MQIKRGTNAEEAARERNFLAFEKRYGFRPQIDPDEEKKYQMGIAKNGEAVLYISGAVNGKDLRMNSCYSPAYEAFVWSKKHEVLNRKTMIIMQGFSTGVFLRALMKKMRPDTDFFVHETEEGLFSYICRYIDITDLIENPRVSLFVTEKQRGEMSQALLWEMATYKPETLGIVTPYYAETREFSEMCESLRIYGISARNYQRTRGRNALRCRMYSWNHLWESATIIDLKKRIRQDMPVVIVSAGPSLLKNVDVLKKIKNHALIICTDRALKVLDERGIEPDFIASVDAEKSPDFLNAEIAKNKRILCSFQLNKESQKKFRGRCIFYCGYDQEKMLLGDKCHDGNGFDHGGNVSGSTFTICRQMGLKKIILIGQDLAYLNGRHHADDVEQGVPDTETRMVEGIDGSMVETCDMWINFRNFFERQIALYPDMEIIDATEGGALIRGSKVMTLLDVAEKVCTDTYDFDLIFKDFPYAQSIDEYKESVEIMNGWVEELNLIEEKSDELVGVCSQLLDISRQQDITDPKHEKMIQKMTELRNEIVSTSMNGVLESFWVEDMYSIPGKDLIVRNAREAEEIFEGIVKYYDKLQGDCSSLKEELIAAILEGRNDSGQM